MKEIEVKSVPTTFKKGGKQCHQLFPKVSKPMQADEFIARFAAALGKTKADARFINDVHGQTFAEALLSNSSVNTGTIRGFLVIGGSVTRPNEPLTKEKNPVMACFIPMGELKDSVHEFVAVNVTETIEAILYSVQYDGSQSLNTIEGTGTLVLTGVGLKLTPSNEDEGVWLEDSDGTAVTDKATITMNDTNLIECAFAELPEAGQYRLIVSTRDGGSSDSLGITRLVRNVIVK